MARKVGSPVRQRLVALLHGVGKGYGYQLHKMYCELYGRCTRENIYYHLRKGVELGEFVQVSITKEKGSYSWGDDVQKIYYALGDQYASKEKTIQQHNHELPSEH